MLSIIFPAFNEENNVAVLHKGIVAAGAKLGTPFEIIAVNDGSSDNTQLELEKLSPITIIELARNFGQAAALDAGIQAAQGETILIMDADLQNDPNDIPRLWEKLKDGYDAVLGWRQNRIDTLNRRLYSFLANIFTRFVLGISIRDFGCALKIFKKEFVREVRLYGAMHTFLGAILHYQGARLCQIPVQHHKRSADSAKYNIINTSKLLADLFTVKFLMRTSRPLLLFGGFGIISWLFSFLAISVAFVIKIRYFINFYQTPLPVISALFIILGFLSIMSGFLAELVLRTYYESTSRTVYRIKKIVNR